MSEFVVSSISDLVAAVAEAERRLGDTQIWARGQSNAAWPLVPGAHRVDGILESQVAQLFRLRAPARHPRCPGHDDLPGWLALMQHYGLRTRLLDWTESPLIASFFAVGSPGPEANSDAAVWLLSPSRLNDKTHHSMIPLLSSPMLKSLVGNAFTFQGGGPIVAVHAAQTDVRMAVQMASFTIHGSPDPLEAISGHSDVLTKLIIPQHAVNGLRRELSLLGLRRSSLFPDLDNLAKELCELRGLSDSALAWE